MVRADSARADWFPEILPVKAAQADRDQAADAAGREEDKAALADPAAEEAVLAELRAVCLEAEEEAVLAAVEVDAAD
jgi:hypothetical protein